MDLLGKIALRLRKSKNKSQIHLRQSDLNSDTLLSHLRPNSSPTSSLKQEGTKMMDSPEHDVKLLSRLVWETLLFTGEMPICPVFPGLFCLVLLCRVSRVSGHPSLYGMLSCVLLMIATHTALLFGA